MILICGIWGDLVLNLSISFKIEQLRNFKNALKKVQWIHDILKNISGKV